MNIFKMWKRNKQITRHIAGATVIHQSPFLKLKIPFVTKELSKDFIDKWVVPFYLERLMEGNNYELRFLQLQDEISPEIITKLLGYFDWRMRITGAYFAALKDYKQFTDFIGINLIKSEVCYAGEAYLVALASFNLPNATEYLIKYLDYYLFQPDLWFDQGDALAALIWLDTKNNTKLVERNQYLIKWESFISNKPNWNLEHYIDFFNRRMTKIELIKQQLKNGS